MKDGLPGPNVYYALQDSKGYIWLATDRGVSRFNGYEFETFDSDDGLPDNTVFEIFEDHLGRIWFAPFNLELAYYENGKIYTYKHNDVILDHAQAYDVASFIHVTKEKKLYLGVYQKGVLCIDSLGQVEVFKNENQEYKSMSVAFTIDGTTYPSSFTSSDNGMNGIETITIGTGTTRKHRPIDINLSPRPVIANLNDKLIFGGRLDLLSWQQDQITLKAFNEWVLNLYVDKAGDLWVSLRNDGLLRFPKGDLKRKPKLYFPGTTVTYILEDHEGGMWFCTEGSGLYYTATLAINQYGEGTEQASKNINTLAIGRENELFFGSNDGKLDHITGDSIHTYLISPGDPRQPEYIRNIYYDEEENKLEFISAGMLTIMDLNLTPPVYNSPIPLIRGFPFLFKDSESRIWLGNKREILGLNPLYEPQQVLKFEEKHSVSSNRLGALDKDAKGNLLVGTYAGFYMAEDGVLKHQGHRNAFFNSRITAILSTQNGIYIGSRSQGLALWRGNTIKVLDKSNGLQSSQINAIAQDAEGRIWLASNTGLDQVSIDATQNWEVKHYGPEHGIPSKEINCLLVHEGIIWMGTTSGLLCFDMNQYRTNTKPPPIHISSISVNQHDTVLMEHYDLGYEKNYINIEFLGIAFRHGSKLRYKYKMKGVDKKWLYTEERNVQYPTLPKGDYFFEVVAENEWGVPSTSPASFSFHISPPWWETLLARSIMIILLVAAITLFFVMRLSAVKKREKERSAVSNEISEMKLKLLRAQMNPHFTFNTINSILDYISKNDRKNARSYLSKFALLLRYILESSDKALNTLAEEIRALELYMQLEQFRFGENLQYKISIANNVIPEFDRIPTMLIQPLIENAILHGIMPKKEPGTVHLKIDKDKNHITVEVEDDGVGRAHNGNNSSNGHKSMSTGIVKDRLRLLNRSKNTSVHFKTTDLKDANGQPSGTRVQLQIAAN